MLKEIFVFEKKNVDVLKKALVCVYKEWKRKELLQDLERAKADNVATVFNHRLPKICFEFTDGYLQVISSDGHRLYISPKLAATNVSDTQLMFYPEDVKDMVNLLKHGNLTVTLNGVSKISFSNGVETIRPEIYTDEKGYVPYLDVIPMDNPYKLAGYTGKLTECLKQIDNTRKEWEKKDLADHPTMGFTSVVMPNFTQFEINPGKLHLIQTEHQDKDLNLLTMEVETSKTIEKKLDRFNLNTALILPYIKLAKGEVFRLEYNIPTRGIKIFTGENIKDNPELFVIMPVLLYDN